MLERLTGLPPVMAIALIRTSPSTTSATPRELTLPEDVEAGANVLLRSVLATDALALA